MNLFEELKRWWYIRQFTNGFVKYLRKNTKLKNIRKTFRNNIVITVDEEEFDEVILNKEE